MDTNYSISIDLVYSTAAPKCVMPPVVSMLKCQGPESFIKKTLNLDTILR